MMVRTRAFERDPGRLRASTMPHVAPRRETPIDPFWGAKVEVVRGPGQGRPQRRARWSFPSTFISLPASIIP